MRGRRHDSKPTRSLQDGEKLHKLIPLDELLSGHLEPLSAVEPVDVDLVDLIELVAFGGRARVGGQRAVSDRLCAQLVVEAHQNCAFGDAY